MNKFSRILENRFILYFIFIVSIVDLVIFVWLGDLKTTSVFILTGFLTTFFNKNMIVVLFFALVVANVYKFGLKGVRESMKSGKKKRDADLEEFLEDMFEDEDYDSEEEDDEPAAATSSKKVKGGGKKIIEKMTSDEMIKTTSEKTEQNKQLTDILNKLNAVLNSQADSASAPSSAAQSILNDANAKLAQIPK